MINNATASETAAELKLFGELSANGSQFLAIAECDGWLSPSIVSENSSFSSQGVHQRCINSHIRNGVTIGIWEGNEHIQAVLFLGGAFRHEVAQ
jgi:hypothetical protein